MKVFGVDRMGSAVFRLGFRDRALCSRMVIEAPAPRTGLLALMDQPAVSLADLPPLPSDTTTLVALSFDWSKSYDAIVKFARELGDTITPNGSEQVDGFLKNLPNILGFDLKRDLFDTLGNVVCFYNDSAAAIPGGFGVGLTVQVKDAENLKKTLDRLFDRLQQIFPNGLTVSHEDEAGRTVSVIGIGPLPIRPAVCVDKHWLHIGLSPQSVRSTLLRGRQARPVETFASGIGRFGQRSQEISIFDSHRSEADLSGDRDDPSLYLDGPRSGGAGAGTDTAGEAVRHAPWPCSLKCLLRN